LGDLRVDGRTILKWDSVDYIDLAQDRDLLCTVVNTVLNLWVSILGGEFREWRDDC
jgi:7-keto-8-aminopelargonate synthetase-like enzyme